MSNWKHYQAMRCIQNRINDLQKEIEITNKVCEKAELSADLFYAKIDLNNFEREITDLQNTLKFLIKQ